MISKSWPIRFSPSPQSGCCVLMPTTSRYAGSEHIPDILTSLYPNSRIYPIIHSGLFANENRTEEEVKPSFSSYLLLPLITSFDIFLSETFTITIWISTGLPLLLCAFVINWSSLIWNPHVWLMRISPLERLSLSLISLVLLSAPTDRAPNDTSTLEVTTIMWLGYDHWLRAEDAAVN